MIRMVVLLLASVLLARPGSWAGAWQDAPTPQPLETPVEPASQQPEPQGTLATPATISSPVPGQVLQGNVLIAGSINVPGFQSAEMFFGYANDSTDTWFLIQSNGQPVPNGALAQWDTTTISDGVYTLKLVVIAQDGSQTTTTVPDLRVRNYTPVETDISTPVMAATAALDLAVALPATPTPSTTLTQTPAPLSTYALSPNPAGFSTLDISKGLLAGVLSVGAAFGIIGLYASLRKALRRD
jgi:hypothetical protein